MTRLLSAILLALLASSAPLTHAAEAPSSQPATTITIPDGSTLELVNTRVLWMKSARPGDTLYLQVNETLYFGDLAAIPAGTYVQAALIALTLPTKDDNEATLHLRFDKLIFSNGYTVALAGNASLARITVVVDSNSDLLLDNGMWLHMQLAAPLPLNVPRITQAASLTAAPGPFQSGTLCRSTPVPNGVHQSSRMPDIVIPGNPGTASTTIVGSTGTTTVPGVPGTPDMRIPAYAGTSDPYDNPIVCSPPPSVRSSVAETQDSASQTPAPAATQQADTVPAGTPIPLTLVEPIIKSSKTGSAVNATVAFPVTLGSQLIIPAGTTLQGTLTEIRSSDKKTHQPRGIVLFTSMVYPNGYTIPLDASYTALLAAPPERTPLSRNSTLFNAGWQFQMNAQAALILESAKALPAAKP